jgi:biopolymer transport protein ExbD
MSCAERLRRRVLGRRESRPLMVVGVALEMAMEGAMMTLLIVMMLIVGTQLHGGFPVDVTASAHAVSLPGATREDAMRILVTRDGAIYFGHQESRAVDIAGQVREKMRGGSERRAYLFVDQRTRYGDVEPVIDAIRAGGVRNLSFVVQQIEPGTRP